MHNDFKLVYDTERYLKERVCSIVEMGRQQSNRAHFISYTIDFNGKKHMAAKSLNAP